MDGAEIVNAVADRMRRECIATSIWKTCFTRRSLSELGRAP